MSGLPDIPPALRLSIAQITDWRFIKVLLLSLGLTLVLTGPFYLVFVVIAWLLDVLLPASISLPWGGEMGFLGAYTVGLASKATWVFWTYVMAPVAMAVIGLFLETVVDAVEARHYRDLPTVRPRPFSELVGYALRFLGLMLAVSLTAFVASFFAGVFAPVIFVAANGYLIAREYFETVALRRVTEQEAKRLTGTNLPALWALGAALALALTVPFVNLIVPIVGVAAFTHMYHRLSRA